MKYIPENRLPNVDKLFSHKHVASAIKKLLTSDLAHLIEEINNIEENEIRAMRTKSYVNDPTKTQALNFMLLKVYKKFIEADKASDTILIADWLLNRSIGKPLDSDRVATIDKGGQKVTYVTSISKTGDIDLQEIHEESDD